MRSIRKMSDGGWKNSAKAWIADMGEQGDYGRRYVLDAPMIARLRRLNGGRALDVGCGEGRFCRILRAEGFDPVGLDPTVELLEAARARDPGGTYVEGRAEDPAFADASFDLVVSCLSLIDIEAADRAIAEMARVLKPGGTLLIANLTSFSSARAKDGWQTNLLGRRTHFAIDHYLAVRAKWEEWRGIRIINWHRPLKDYMQWFLAQGLVLTHFDEPAPTGGDPSRADRYRRAPWYVIMEWRKP
ncbi:class I SAM-dependent methyltransferase [Caulobacter vibrioides]|uniref:Methyltransferase, putative n=2 Tax=Caulobacter vibrioides TaxID=155892 RepID=Q9A780_CAUVC|nr:class I SAM-dependent methyltransferase [Caulobacter vibrioides]YP_002517295.1 SAM-dependent methyltransferase [Caulobacter vibrioides NA1000]AAK23821.1 methyltransferase, putative [Caulobacter vibrioides CB15]ACL95387.1 SAM-dependent methyltransferase [Caulobacter vibrioides NA1000]ATC28721.1 class I SAM-dependent methyltransferase [Caulobacter vibrioides]QXZ50233.1 class I SAM-dependent methyltransferase [Caulobacter vibrioides]